MIPGDKMKIPNLTAHVHPRDMPIHILEYQWSTPEILDVVKVTNFTEKGNFVFRPSFDPMKIPKPNCTSTRHT